MLIAFVIVFAIIFCVAIFSHGRFLSKFTPFAFLTGGVWSMLAGFIGMKIATHANARTTQAASESLNRGLRVAFSAGSVMGFTVVALGLLDITLWFFILYRIQQGAGTVLELVFLPVLFNDSFSTVTMHIMLSGYALYQFAIALTFYLISRYRIKNRLNLE